MESVSLIALVVEYEVPPSLVIAAVNDGRLHPIVRKSEALSLNDIAFRKEEVDNLFWAFELKHKSADMKAELERRFQRHDSIVAGIIGAVAAAGVIAIATEVFEPLRLPKNHPSGPGVLGNVEHPPTFRPPVEDFDCCTFMRQPTQMLIIRRDDLASEIVMAAAADGVVATRSVRARLAHRQVSIVHGQFWITQYGWMGGAGQLLVSDGQHVSAGHHVMKIEGRSGEVIGTWRVLRRERGFERVYPLREVVLRAY